MLSSVNGNTQGYLDNLDRIQSDLNTVHRQISSGVRVGVASDDPAAVSGILSTQRGIAMDEQLQTNLNRVKSELQSGDSALQQAAKLMDQAVATGTQGSNTGLTSSAYDNLLQQAVSIQSALVGIASTSVNGRYIFSGDHDSKPLYVADATQSTGVRQTATAASTVVITDRNGQTVWRPITAKDIFDTGDASTGNVFGAVASLITALQSKDPQAAQAAVAGLKAASDHVSQQLGLYGIGETRLDDAARTASAAEVTEKQALSASRDTDVAGAAIQLSQSTLQQQATLSVGARLAQKSLFDYLA